MLKLVNPRLQDKQAHRSVRGACMLNPVARRTIHTLVPRVHDRTGWNFDGNAFAFFGTRLILRRTYETR